MPWHLDIAEGPASPRKIDVKPGQTITFGRANGAIAMFQADEWMSSMHFAVGIAGDALRLQNLSQTNGTEVNGQRCETVLLRPGDRVKAGQTVFVVRAPAPSPFSSQVRFGGWGFSSIPEGWQCAENIGFHFMSPNAFKASITAVEEPLPAGQTLSSYVETQIKLARDQVAGMILQDPVPTSVLGSDEALLVEIVATPRSDLRVIQRQIYALSSGTVGVFTTTVSESEPHEETLKTIISGLSYFQG